VNINKYPWHIALYRLDQNKTYEYICGGNIVTPKIIFSGISNIITFIHNSLSEIKFKLINISAAHCVYNEETKQITDRTLLKVFAGKYYRDYNRREPNAESRQVNLSIDVLFLTI
jgi:hypothetical protein